MADAPELRPITAARSDHTRQVMRQRVQAGHRADLAQPAYGHALQSVAASHAILTATPIASVAVDLVNRVPASVELPDGFVQPLEQRVQRLTFPANQHGHAVVTIGCSGRAFDRVDRTNGVMSPPSSMSASMFLMRRHCAVCCRSSTELKLQKHFHFFVRRHQYYSKTQRKNHHQKSQ